MINFFLEYIGLYIIIELLNDVYVNINDKIINLFRFYSLKKIILIYGLYKGYILNRLKTIKNRMKNNVKVIDNKLKIKYVYNGEVKDVELYLDKFNNNNIMYVDYIKNDKYESNIDLIVYNNSLLRNSIKNVYYTPYMLGYNKVKIRYMNENLEEIEKEYVENDKIIN
jgi:hypothetical protein